MRTGNQSIHTQPLARILLFRSFTDQGEFFIHHLQWGSTTQQYIIDNEMLGTKLWPEYLQSR